MEDSYPVVVIGAGLVGSMAALMLARRGYSVKVFEMRQDYRKARAQAVGENGHELHGLLTNATKRSINLALSHRGLSALRSVGLEELAMKNSVPMEGRMIHLPHQADIGKAVFRPYEHRILLDEIEKLDNVEVCFESKFESYDKATGNVTISTSQQPQKITIPSQFVVGADGAFSRVRDELGRLVRLDCNREYIKHGYKELCIPAKNGDYVMCGKALHVWPRHEFVMCAFPNNDKSFTCTLFMPFEDLDKIQTPEHVRAFFRQWFPDVAGQDFELMPTLVEDFFRNPTSSLLSVKCDPWNYKGKLLLIGDAAHATVPFYGQGMNAGFEDCLRLDEMLSEAAVAAFGKSEANRRLPASAMEAVMTRFSAEMVPSGRGLVDVSLYNYVELRSKTASPLFFCKQKLDLFLESALPPWLYKWQPLYTMVAFTRTPYHIARLRAQRQDVILYSAMAVIVFAAAAAASVAGSELGVK